jgi:D-sedoheptulose 7-phosphate isomerase
MEWIEDHIEAARQALEALRRDRQGGAAALGRICEAVVACLEGGGKVLTLGNGGSATDAAHLAEELLGRFRANRAPLAAVCLAADAAALTCIANDFGYEQVFARQVRALARPGDAVVAFSTSGNSANVAAALEEARRAGARTIGLLGGDGGRALAACDLAFVAPGAGTARIQELHTLALHLICEAVERRFGPPAADSA